MNSRRQFMKTCLCGGVAACSCPLNGWARYRAPVPSAVDQLSPDDQQALERVAGTARIAEGFEPGYLALHRSGELRRRGVALWQIMEQCELCPRKDETRRLEGEEGECKSSHVLEVASYKPHFGEERPLVGRGGSGTIFFANCSLKCVFCINWRISREGQGDPCDINELAWMMLRLQGMGCHNINVVTPTHYSPHIVLALDRAAAFGLRLPLVYNTCGWERKRILRLLDGVVDIYLPDFKYWDPQMAITYSSAAREYPEITRQALLEMQRQVGTARTASDGLIYRGLMIRHLVMPNNVGGSVQVVRWIAENLPRDTYVNIMAQYRPCYQAENYPDINRTITRKEYNDVVRAARKAGLTALDVDSDKRLPVRVWDLF